MINDTLDRRLNVAPMMGCTDRHYRYLLRLISPHALLYSEMVVSGALQYGHSDHFLAHEHDTPCALQIGGSDPLALSHCAPLIEAAGYQEINLNVGCPSDRVQYGGIGACLMATPELVRESVSAMQSVVSIPVTVKTRIGIDDSDSYSFFSDFINTVAESGCRVFIIHARKAVLKGLSPKENRNVPPLKYDYVREIKKERPDLCFVLNGECHKADPQQLMSEFDGLMYGRRAYQDPWLLAELETQLFQQPKPDRNQIIQTYISYMERQMSKGTAFKHMARHLLGYYLGCRGARRFRQLLSEKMFSSDADLKVLEQAIEQSGVGGR